MKWKPVVGYPGFMVSDTGIVRRADGSLVKPRKNEKGYVQVSLPRAGKCYTRKVHRLVLEAFRGADPDRPEGGHRNGVRDDNRLSNLKWMTKAENQSQTITDGTSLAGMRSNFAKLTPELIAKARKLRLLGLSHEAIAANLGIVTRRTVGRVLTGRTWSRPHAFTPRVSPY